MNDSNVTRQSLIVRVRNACDAVAWGEFVEIYTPIVFRFLRRQGLQDADAADVTQEVFRSVATAIHSFTPQDRTGSFRSWLLTVTKNKFLDHVKRAARQAQGSGDTHQLRMLAEVSVDAEDSLFVEREYRRSLFEHAARFVRKEMTEKSWLAFWRTQVEGQPTAGVAEQLEMTVDAVYVARSRVMARLRERIAMFEDE